MVDPKADKTDLMLLLLYAPDHTGLEARAMHGITRLEKLLFLLEMEGGLARLDERYQFEAYRFGPFSSEVYDVIEALQGWELVNVEHRTITDYYASAEADRLHDDLTDEDYASAEAQRLDDDLTDEEEDEQAVSDSRVNERSAVREKIISLTDRGKRLAEKLSGKLTEDEWSALTRVKQKYGAMSLRHLITYVYETYPDYAIKSELA